MAKRTYISIITVNVNGLNAPIKRYRLAEQIQKKDQYTCFLQEIHFRPRDTYRLKVWGQKKKGSEKIFEEIIVENFPNMGKEIVNQVQEHRECNTG